MGVRTRLRPLLVSIERRRERERKKTTVKEAQPWLLIQQTLRGIMSASPVVPVDERSKQRLPSSLDKCW
ncbi:uncharacterized protein V6R79_011603 [Siganus canaliculatus]